MAQIKSKKEIPQTKTVETVDAIYSRNHFSISFIPIIDRKAIISRNSGNYELKSSSQLGSEAGFDYYHNLNKSYSLITGLHAGVNGRNYILHISKNDYNPPATSDEDYSGALTREKDIFYLNLPLLMEKRWLYFPKKIINVIVGINIRYSLEGLQETTVGYIYNQNSELVQDFSMELNLNNHKKPWINYNIGGGHSWILNNNNIIKADLLLNISFRKFVKGLYQITVPGQPVTEGTYGITGTYIGLSIGYIFTGFNKKFVEELEKGKNY